MKAIVGTWGLGAVACVSVALSLGACGSSDDDKGSPGMQNTGGSSGSGATTGGTSGSAGTGTGAGAGGSSAGSSALPVAGAPDETGAGKGGGGGSGGQTSEPTGTVSNLPGVDFQVTLTLPGSNLVLVSSNLTLDTSTNYVEWFAEVRNLGTIPACFVQAEVDFADHTGAIVESLMSFSDGDAYEIGSDPSLSSPCIAPGKSSVIWANDIPDIAPDITSITVAKVTLTDSGLGTDAVPHPSTPTVDSTAITQSSTLGAGFWSFSGMGTATATIYNVEAQAYFRSAAGLIVDHPDAFHLDTWLAATDWAFESLTGYEGAKPASFIFSWSFLNGAEGASASVANLSGLQKRVLAVYDARFSVLDAMRARHDRVYGSAH